MKGIKTCKRCRKKILIDEKAVCLHTFIGDKNLEKVYWHFNCYLSWRDECIEIKAKKIYNNTFNKIIPIMSTKLKNMFNNEETKDKLLRMGSC